MEISAKKIAWLAGFLEGEGCFGFCNGTVSKKSKVIARYGIRIDVSSTDLDVVTHAASLLGTAVHRRKQQQPHHKIQWRTQLVDRDKAAAWLMTLYPLMGSRRQARFKELLAVWRAGAWGQNGNYHT